MVRNFRKTHPNFAETLYKEFTDNFCDSCGDPYWDAKEDLFSPPLDLDENPDLSWWLWTRMDYEELECAEKELEEDALIKAWGGDQPKRLSMRRQTLMKRR